MFLSFFRLCFFPVPILAPEAAVRPSLLARRGIVVTEVVLYLAVVLTHSPRGKPEKDSILAYQVFPLK